MNKLSKPEPANEKAPDLSADARRRAAMDQLLALFREISADAQARGVSLTQAEIDDELALHKAERRV